MNTKRGKDFEDFKAKFTDVYRTFQAQVEPLQFRHFDSGGSPETLCHYTDFAGLKGILETGSIWATFIRTMNDGSEGQYGLDLIQRFCAHAEQESPPWNLTENYSGRNFAICFCTSSDVLSMWTTYASRGGGFCLEFAGVGGLLSAAIPPYSVIRFKVLYEEEVPPLIADIIEQGYKFAKAGKMEKDAVLFYLSLFALQLKHPAFSQEKEWRFVVRNPVASDLRFRPGHADIKPYVELKPSTADGRLPLRRLVFGPTLRHDGALIESLQMLLERYGYQNVLIESCGIPYRL